MRGTRDAAAAALGLALLAAGCAAASAPTPLPPPWPVAESADGAWRLRIQHVERRRVSESPEAADVSIQAQIEPALGPDVLVALDTAVAPLRKVVTSLGASLPVDEMHASLDPRSGMVAVHGIRMSASAANLREVEFQVRLLRVTKWTEHVSRPVDLGEGIDLPCPPARAFIRAEPGVCWVSAAYGEDSENHPRRQEFLGHLGHDAIAGGAVVRDSRGRTLVSQMGVGSGGSSSFGFVPREAMESAGRGGPFYVDYPVTVTVRMPEEFTVETVLFRFEDLRLPPARKAL
jgi:hypothetical protein